MKKKLTGDTFEVRARQTVELTIAMSAVDELLAQGFSISVDYGDGAGERLTTRNEILAALMQGDDDTLQVYRNSLYGWLRFIYGNSGWDVLSDYSVNLEKHMPKTLALCDDSQWFTSVSV